VSAGGDALSSLPTWATWSIAAAALLSPVLVFLMAIAVEILIGVLKDAGMHEFLALVAVSVIGWLLIRKLWVRPRKRPGRDMNLPAELPSE
jgi:membrane protein DedA with SNARE-associated domain